MSRPNVGSAYLDKSKPLPELEFDKKESNLESAIDWIKKNGNKKRIYKVFVEKNLMKDMAWNEKQEWHQIASKFDQGCSCLGLCHRDRECNRIPAAN